MNSTWLWPSVEKMPELSFWQKSVWLRFNPSWDDQVWKLKQLYATIIDKMDALRNSEWAWKETKRLASIAITEAQSAQMRAVKAQTRSD